MKISKIALYGFITTLVCGVIVFEYFVRRAEPKDSVTHGETLARSPTLLPSTSPQNKDYKSEQIVERRIKTPEHSRLENIADIKEDGIEVLADNEISPHTIFNSSKFTPEDVQTRFEDSLKNIDVFASVAKIEKIECSLTKCKMVLSEQLPDEAQAALYSYYLDHPKFGRWIHSDKSKEDPNKIVYTFTDDVKTVETN